MKFNYSKITTCIVAILSIFSMSAQNAADFVPSMTHPGVMHTTQSIEAMRNVVKSANKKDPAYQAYLQMVDDYRAKADYTMKGPLKNLDRSPNSDSNARIFRPDFESAYMNAILWCVTGERARAEKSIEILTSYGNVTESINGHNNAPLLAGIQGFQIAATLELLKYTYDGLSQADYDNISGLLKRAFIPVIEKFYVTPAYTNGNWGHCVNRAYMAMAILWEDKEMYQKAVDFYFNGEDNGTLPNYIDPVTGQCQESGRDQAHVQFGIACMASICEIAYNQGNDLYGALDNSLLRGYEYTAKYLCGYDDVPFKTWKDATVASKYSRWAVISDEAREKYRPMWRIAYNHYVSRLGMEMPYTKEYLDKNKWLGKYDTDGIWYDVFQFCGGEPTK